MVSVRQLRAAEIGPQATNRRVERGVLIDQGRGVYAFGYERKDDMARAWRAVLMYPRTALSRTSSAWAHGLRLELGRIHLSSITNRRSTAAAQIHLVRTLETVVQRGLPCTPLAQTFLDCAASLPPGQLIKMLHRAEELRTFDLTPILPVLSEKRGSPALREALRIHRARADYSHSELERRFRALIRAAGLPEPAYEMKIGPYYVDAVYLTERIAIELDGGTHLTPSRYDEDTRRNAQLTLWGWRPVRFTWWQVTEDPDYVVRTLAAML
jgi:very-short-patch-repair endonuclease